MGGNPWDDDDGRPDPIDDQHYVARDGSGGWQQRLIGDGMAVDTRSFMNWDGPRVPVPTTYHDGTPLPKVSHVSELRSEFKPTPRE